MRKQVTNNKKPGNGLYAAGTDAPKKPQRPAPAAKKKPA